MLTAEKRAQILPVWAGLASVIAIDFLTSNFWTALLIGAFVGGSVVLARPFDDAKQWIIRKTRTKVSAYEQIYQAHVRVDQVINADAPVDAEGSAIMGHPLECTLWDGQTWRRSNGDLPGVFLFKLSRTFVSER